MFETYHSINISDKLCLIIKGIAGKIRNYGSCLALFNNCLYTHGRF